MSEENASGVVDDAKAGSQQNKEDDFVPKKSYVEVRDDMHKYKNELKETKAALAERDARLEADDRAKMEAEKRYEELYKQSQSKLDEVSQARDIERDKFLNVHKINALLTEVGGVKKREYVKHANVDAIEINEDGSINEDSLKAEAERFRKDHFVLLKGDSKTTLPNKAPENTNIPQKSVEQMNEEERSNKLRGALKNLI